MAPVPDKIYNEFSPSADMEFYCIFKDGRKEWIDPVCIYKEDKGIITVSSAMHTYVYYKEDLQFWELRRREC